MFCLSIDPLRRGLSFVVPRIRGVTKKYLFAVDPLIVDKSLRPLVKKEEINTELL